MKIFDPKLTGSIEIQSPISSSVVITGSLVITGSFSVSGSVSITASQAQNSLSASYALSSSLAENSITASFVTTAQTASFVTTAQTASFVTLAQTSSYVQLAQTASFVATASWAVNSVTASFVTLAQTASFVTTAETASFVTTAQTASFVTLSQTASYVTGSIFTSTNQALSASQAQNANTVGGIQPSTFITTGSQGSTQTISGSLVIIQNLTIQGTSSIQNVTASQLNISTNIITVNTQNPSFRFGGLAAIDSGSSPQQSGSLLYDSVQDEWIFVHRGTSTSAVTSSHVLMGPETYGAVGDEIYVTANRLIKSIGNEHVTGSNILDDGTTITINSNTQLTGSLIVTSFISSSGGFTGSLLGTASWANNSITASYVTGSVHTGTNPALTASFASTASFAITASNWLGSDVPYTGSRIVSGSMTVIGPSTISGSLNLTGSANIIGSSTITGSLVVSGSGGYGVFSKGVTLADLTNGFSVTGSYFVWRCPYPATVVNLWAIKSGSASVSVNARRSGSGAALHTGSNLVITANNLWSSVNSVQNTTYSAGDSLEIIFSGSGILQSSVQVDFIKR